MNGNAETLPLGVSLNTLDPEQRVETVDLLTGSSVRALEVRDTAFKGDAGRIAALGNALKAAGIEYVTVHAEFGAEIDFSSLDASAREGGMQTARSAFDLAAELGARVVILHPSSEPIEDEVRGARMQTAKRSLATIAKWAREAECRLAVELLPRTGLGRCVAELLELLDGLPPERAGACLDTNHLMADYAALPAAVRTLGPRLFALHCSDYDGVDEKHWLPGRGVVDWSAFLAALREVGFPGPLHYEAALPGKTAAERLIALDENYRVLQGSVSLT